MKRIRKYATNLNIIILLVVGFAVWLLFFDNDSYLNNKQVLEQIEELEAQRDSLLHKIAQDSNVIRNIEDSAFLVKFARENYLFVEDDELVYIIEKK